MLSGRAATVGTANSVMVPLGVMRPILPPPLQSPLPTQSVNQRLPSGPAVMSQGALSGRPSALGTANSVMVPLGVMRPILLPPMQNPFESRAHSVNQRLPSGPAVMPKDPLLGVGRANSVMVPLGVMRPIWWPGYSVNQRLPSGPAVMRQGPLLGVGTANSCTAPVAGLGVAVAEGIMVAVGAAPLTGAPGDPWPPGLLLISTNTSTSTRPTSSPPTHQGLALNRSGTGAGSVDGGAARTVGASGGAGLCRRGAGSAGLGGVCQVDASGGAGGSAMRGALGGLVTGGAAAGSVDGNSDVGLMRVD